MITSNANPFVLTEEMIGPAIKGSINLLGAATAQLTFTEVLADTVTVDEIGGS